MRIFFYTARYTARHAYTSAPTCVSRHTPTSSMSSHTLSSHAYVPGQRVDTPFIMRSDLPHAGSSRHRMVPAA